MIMEIIQYIRNLLPGNHSKSKRKRSVIEDFEFPVTAKIRKTCISPISVPEEDWFSNSSSLSLNRTRRSHQESKPLWQKPMNTIVIDDDDTDKKPIYHTSTPNVSKAKENLFEDLSFKSKDINRPTKMDNIDTHRSSFSGQKFRNYKSPVLSIFKDASSYKRPSFASTYDYTVRLDEKRKYEELLKLSKVQNVAHDYDSFADYRTPVGKIQPLSRTRKILDSCRTIDLTNGSCERSKLSTRDTIRKVLESMDNDVIVVKDSDSDVEILPSPPSPKPDIRIEPVNSLKSMIIHPSDPQHENWITNKLRKHQESVVNRKKEIEKYQANLNQIKGINEDLRTKQLEEQVRRSLHIKEVVLPVEFKQKLPKLTAAQQGMVNSAFNKNENHSAILASKFSLNITRRDMLTLSGLNWLNDEVINFYMNLIIERGKLGNYPKTYAFNTFFYPKLIKDGHSSIRRWTRKIDIFSYDLICVPIHMSMHWCMAIIDLRARTVSYYDSMGKPNYQCVEALLRYLQEEHLDKKKAPFDSSNWKLKCLKDIPQQMNGSDCGMFSCTYAEFVSRNASFTFSQEDMPYLRRKMVVEIMLGELLIH